MPMEDTKPVEHNCAKCGAVTELLTFLPRFGDEPAYRIFECSACKALTWIAEAIGQ